MESKPFKLKQTQRLRLNMNCGIDNTKYAKVIIIETNDRSEETQVELAEYMFGLFDKGWKTLVNMRMTANGNRVVLYWPEYKIK